MRTKLHNIIAVGAGKGGTGKSTLSCLIALSLLSKSYKVAIADLDIYGPSIPAILSIKEPLSGGPVEGIIPPKTIDGLQVFSDELLMKNKSTTVLWNGNKIREYITNNLKNLNWGKELDFLVLDLPPGTGESPQSFISFVQNQSIKSGIVFVSSPQDISLNDIKKAITMAHILKEPIIGIIENMSSFTCPECKTVHKIFGDGKVSKLCADQSIEYLGYMPLVPELSIVSDISLNLKSIPSEVNKCLEPIMKKILNFYEE